MGFWQGLNEGLGVVREEKARKKEFDARQQEIQTERDIRRQEREQDYSRQKEMFTLQQNASRQDALYAVYLKRQQEKAAAVALRGKANTFIGRLGESNDPRVSALMSDPATAAQLEDTVQEIERKRAESGVDMPPLQGKVLLDLLTVQVPETGQVKAVDIDLEEINTADLSNTDEFFRLNYELTRPVTPSVSASINPKAYFIPNPKTLEEGRVLFDDLVLQQANAYRETVANDPNKAADIDSMLKEYATEGSAGRTKLRAMFGPAAAETLLASSDNPYLSSVQQDPQLAPFVNQASANIEQQQLRAIVDNPGTPPDQRQEAIDLLKTRHGIAYAGANVNGR